VFLKLQDSEFYAQGGLFEIRNFESREDEGPGETNWKNLHFQRFHTNTFTNPIKSDQFSVTGGNKLKKPPFSTFPYQHLGKSDQMASAGETN